MKVLVTNLMMQKERPRFEKILSEKGLEYHFPEVKQYLKEEELLSLMGSYDAWLAGDDEITHKVLTKSLPKLKVISKWGTGIDSIDKKACEALGVKLFNSPGAFKDAVAEVALGFMLDLSRELSFIDRSVRSGRWPKPMGDGLMGKTLGIIGFGAIGQGICERALAFKMKVQAYDPYVTKTANSLSTMTSFETLIKTSDYICLACNMSTDNFHLINSKTIQKMKEGVTLINVARGPLVDEKALIKALESGKIKAAGLDVFEKEPLMDSPLLKMDQVILGSHNANNMTAAIESVHQNTMDNLLKGLKS